MNKKMLSKIVMMIAISSSSLSYAGNYTDTDTVSFTLSKLSNVTFNYTYDDLLYYTFDQGKKVGDRTAEIGSLVWTDVYGVTTSLAITPTKTDDNQGSFTFNGLGAGSYTASLSGTWTYQGQFGESSTYISGGNVSLASQVTPVPEPGEWALMLSGLGLMGYMVRRRQQNRTAV